MASRAVNGSPGERGGSGGVEARWSSGSALDHPRDAVDTPPPRIFLFFVRSRGRGSDGDHDVRTAASCGGGGGGGGGGGVGVGVDVGGSGGREEQPGGDDELEFEVGDRMKKLCFVMLCGDKKM